MQPQAAQFLEQDRPFDTQWYEAALRALRALPDLPPEK
ncbi:hypothetical protein ALP41_05036 [Pseudomonas savastanoi pv. nerii]|nr:hypothetical protein ALP41_05036 [Pseudomonas savastanoi pv. nerii]RMU43688.1 hypothetical protein ALP28_04750 [Pseudomonas savastanoi pv. nerii]